MNKIPVTIITGFLGAGKTTLLNKLIADHKDKRFAVIENEFGEIGIDGAMVVDAKDGIFELSNGCLCCSLNDDLVEVLQKIIKREQRIGHLIIETTGIADPGPIAMNFLSDPNIRAFFYIDGIITLTDAQFIEQQLEDHETACCQVTMADVVIINKTDKADAYQTDTARNIIKRMNPGAQILLHRLGQEYDIDLLDLHAFTEGSFLNVFNSIKDKAISYAGNKTEAPKSLFATTKNIRHEGIVSHSFIFPEELDVLKFNIFIRAILTEQLSIYRIKGILQLKDVDEKIIFQSVNSQYSTDSAGKWPDDENRVTRIIFIGKKLNRNSLQNGLDLCISSEAFDPDKFYSQLNDVILDLKKSV